MQFRDVKHLDRKVVAQTWVFGYDVSRLGQMMEQDNRLLCGGVNHYDRSVVEQDRLVYCDSDRSGQAVAVCTQPFCCEADQLSRRIVNEALTLATAVRAAQEHSADTVDTSAALVTTRQYIASRRHARTLLRQGPSSPQDTTYICAVASHRSNA
jgi:hypothetical protein